MVGIGDYDTGVMPPLIGANQDYINIIYTFYHILGYSILYKNKNNQIEYIKKKNCNNINTNSKNDSRLSLHESKANSKVHWTDEELEEFFEKTKTYIESNKHDSCIFVLSAHGEQGGVILSSNGEEVSLEALFYQYMGQSCKYLIDKPKIVFIDACRGKMRAKPIVPDQRDMFMHENNNDIHSVEESKNTLDDHDGMNTSGIQMNDDKYGKFGMFRDGNESNSAKNDIASFYHPRANFMVVYANPDGYVAGDGGFKGGYLIRAIKRVFSNVTVSLNDTLDDLVAKVRLQAKQMAGMGAVQCVEHVSTMTYKVSFC